MTASSPGFDTHDEDDAALQLVSLVEHARSGDMIAFKALVESHQRPLYYSIMRRINHPQDAADIVQQTFVKVFEKLDTLRDPAAFRGWLYQIALNFLRAHIRQGKRLPNTSLDDAPNLHVEARSERTLLAREQLSHLRDSLHTLSPKQREVLALRLDSDLSYREIAAAIDSTEGAVRVHFHNAIRRLKEALDHHDSPT